MLTQLASDEAFAFIFLVSATSTPDEKQQEGRKWLRAQGDQGGKERQEGQEAANHPASTQELERAGSGAGL